jgi:hypothetical protein
MKLLIIFSVFLLTHISSMAQRGAFIAEGTYAKSLNLSNAGFNAGIYYKSRWAVAVRVAVATAYGDRFEGFAIGYVQAGYMQQKKKMMYQFLIGLDPYVISGGTLMVYTAGAGYPPA